MDNQEKIDRNEEPDWDFLNMAWNLEEQWRKNQKQFSDVELLKIFPEAKGVIPEKLIEWKKEKNKLSEIIKKKLTLIKQRTSHEFSQWFWRHWVKVTDGPKLMKIDGHITRLKRLLWTASGKAPSKSIVTRDQIQRALAVPIENLINRPSRKSGKALVGLCPLHNEQHPSFYVYPETNSWWCYGCNHGHDAINLVRQLHGYSFKEAVQYLLNK